MTADDLIRVVELLAVKFRSEQALIPVIRYAGEDHDVAALLDRAAMLDDEVAPQRAAEATGLPLGSPVSLIARVLRERARVAVEETTAVTYAARALDPKLNMFSGIATIADAYLKVNR